MQQVIPIYAYQHTKSSRWAEMESVLTQIGYITRSGYSGSRTLTSGGYVYIVPTDYRRYNNCRSLFRETHWDGYGPYWSGDVYLDARSVAGTWVFTDWQWGSNPQSAAKAHAYSNLRSNMCNYAMLTKDLYDGIKMSQDYFDRLAKAAPYLGRKQFGKAFNAFFGTSKKRKAAANTWLEFQWGVKPTINAVQETLARATTDDARVIRVTAGAKSMSTLANNAGDNWTFGGAATQESSCRCYRYFKNIYQLEAQAFNPIEPAFDAIPWSFLVGWFIPIEEYLLQFGYVPMWTETMGCDSELTRVSSRIQYFRYQYDMRRPFGGYNDRQWVPLGSTDDYLEFTRTRASGVTLPLSFMEMLDRGKLNMSINRLVSSVALVTQRLK